jgi:hypothetical protein
LSSSITVPAARGSNDSFQEDRFAGPICTKHGDDRTAKDVKADAVEHRLVAVTGMKITY